MIDGGIADGRDVVEALQAKAGISLLDFAMQGAWVLVERNAKASGTYMNEIVSSIQGSRSVIVCSSFLTDGRQRQPCSIGELADVVLLGSVGSSIVAIPAGLAALAIRVIASEQDSIGFVSMEKPFEGSNDGDPV